MRRPDGGDTALSRGIHRAVTKTMEGAAISARVCGHCPCHRRSAWRVGGERYSPRLSGHDVSQTPDQLPVDCEHEYANFGDTSARAVFAVATAYPR